MVSTKVRAMIDGVKVNGKRYVKGDEFQMEQSLVKPHMAAGQVETIMDVSGGKAQGTPKDKMAGTPKSK